MTRPILHYVADPMCAWCWGFAPVLAGVLEDLGDAVEMRYVMGGLAPDSDEPMPAAVRAYVQSAWDAVERTAGVTFNRAFWTKNEPRRSTWPACRAVLAAGEQDAVAKRAMFEAIQRAYYVEARNPSNRATLLELAAELPGLDGARFERDLSSSRVKEMLAADLARRDALGIQGFPSVAWEAEGAIRVLSRGYAPSGPFRGALRDVWPALPEASKRP